MPRAHRYPRAQAIALTRPDPFLVAWNEWAVALAVAGAVLAALVLG